MRFILRGVVFFSACALAAAPAAGQVNSSERPYKGLFGGSAADPNVRHSLDGSVSLTGGYDDNVLAEEGGFDSVVSPFLTSGFYAGLSGTLDYAWRGQRVQVAGSGGSSGRYFLDEGRFLGSRQFGALGLSAALGRRTTLNVNQSVTYTPAYTYGLFPEVTTSSVVQVVGFGEALGDEMILVSDTSASLSQRVGRRSTVDAHADLRYSDLPDTSNNVRRNLRSYSVGGRYSHGLTRYTSLRAGYAYRKGSYLFSALNRPVTLHDIDVGINYNRPLSISRRTTISFSLGTSAGTGDETQGGEFTFRGVGSVDVRHQFGRTWSAAATYNRAFGFSEVFPGPVFSDAVYVNIGGFFNRRTDFVARAGYSNGSVDFQPSQGDFRVYNASTRLRFGLSRSLALFTEYAYYYHDLGTVVTVPAEVPSRLDRNSVQVGLTLWMPLFSR